MAGWVDGRSLDVPALQRLLLALAAYVDNAADDALA